MALTRFAAVVLIAVVAAVAGVAFASSPLPRITPDSEIYLTGAENLAADGRFYVCDDPITLWAPGYSATMVPLVMLGVDAPAAARVINLLATVALILAAGALASAVGLSRRVSVFVSVATAVSFMTLRNGAFVWSEQLFCALLAWLAVVIVNRGAGLRLEPSRRLAAALALAWSLMLTRHAGLFLVPGIIAAGWLGSASMTRRALRTAALAAGLVAVPGIWWIRNFVLGDAPFGERVDSPVSTLDVLQQLPDGLSSLMLPSQLPLAIRLVLLLPLVVALVLVWRRTRGSATGRLSAIVLGALVLSYLTLVTAAASRTVLDALDTRLLAPIFVPAAVLVALGLVGPARISWTRRSERALTGATLLVVAFAVLAAPAVVWKGHTETDTRRIDAVTANTYSCADWPALYPRDE